MTPAEFVSKFPTKKDIINVCADGSASLLEDMACPRCGFRSRFYIVFSGTAAVTDDSSEDVGDHAWDEHSPCTCGGCDHKGEVVDFIIPGLDAHLESLNP